VRDLDRAAVLVRLPDDKEVVIDAEVSLIAYELALPAEIEGGRESALKAHVASVRGHVRRLAEQTIEKLNAAGGN